MIVYQESKETFMSYVCESKIDYIIHENFKKELGHKTSESEVRSWANSMQYMRNVLDGASITNDAKISIECQVPNTSKRQECSRHERPHEKRFTESQRVADLIIKNTYYFNDQRYEGMFGIQQ